MDDGQIHTLKISYEPGLLSIFYDDLNTSVIDVSVNLHDRLNLDNGQAYAGFSAWTGAGYENDDVLNWSYDYNSSPFISIEDSSVIEGDSGTVNMEFTVELSQPSTELVTFDYTTIDDSATAGVDYVAQMGQLEFLPGQTQATFAIVVNGDDVEEPYDDFLVSLSNAVGAVIADPSATGTILNDETTVLSDR